MANEQKMMDGFWNGFYKQMDTLIEASQSRGNVEIARQNLRDYVKENMDALIAEAPKKKRRFF